MSEGSDAGEGMIYLFIKGGIVKSLRFPCYFQEAFSSLRLHFYTKKKIVDLNARYDNYDTQLYLV